MLWELQEFYPVLLILRNILVFTSEAFTLVFAYTMQSIAITISYLQVEIPFTITQKSVMISN